ncbi:MAG: protein kinase [Planctomycetes bacterium]|nr:protein kinase [Planctomycetota bacterium]
MPKHPIRCPYCNRSFEAKAAEFDPEEELSATDETVAMEVTTADDTDDAEALPGENHPENTSKKIIASSRLTKPDALGIGSGEYFGDYEIIREIARGGMGIIYLARQRKLRRTVALKVLRAGEGASEEDISRFLREAEAAASLAHPNIVPIHELDVHKGRAFFTMDFIEGPSLETMISEGRLTLRRAVQILEEIALAIHYAHGKGIIHRDLKPANVILAPDRHPMITDFGLAVNLSRNPATQRMTHSGVVMGTIPYIPPEQASGDVDQVGPAGDVYSMGAILYEMITGKPPFEGETQFELLHCVINRDPVPPRKLNPKIPVDLQTICLKCLDKSIHRRYSSARALADDCRAYLNREVIQARPATPAYRFLRLVSRHRGLSILAGFALCLVVIFFFTAKSLSEGKEKVEERQEKIEKQLEEKNIDFRRLEEKNEELTASLERGWRLVFEEDFTKRFNNNWLVNRGRADFARNYLILRGMESSPEGPVTVNAALKNSYSNDCQVKFKVRIPKKGGSSLKVLVSGKSLDLDGNFGYLFALGSPASPGLSIEKGPVTLARKVDFVITPEAWHTVSIERNGKKLSLIFDDCQLLDVSDETVLHSDEYNRIGFIANNGFVYLDEIQVLQPGSSPQMLINMLDMADNIYRHGRLDQLTWAIEMSEQVALESADPVLHVRALRRAVACYMRIYGTFRQARNRLNDLVDRLQRNSENTIKPGEADYLYGLLELQNQNYLEAMRYFDKTAEVIIPEGTEEIQNVFPLLGHLEGILARIRQGAVDEAIDKFTEMQRRNLLTAISKKCREHLLLSNANVILLAEVDRLLEAEEASQAWSFMEALQVLFPESGRDLSARYMSLANIYGGNGEWSFAIDLLKKAGKLAGEWEEPRLALGDAYLANGNREKAQEAFIQARTDFPNSITVNLRLAAFLLDSKQEDDYVLALDAARQAVTLSAQKDTAALELLARALIATGNTEEALTALKTAIAVDPEEEHRKMLKQMEDRIIIPRIESTPATEDASDATSSPAPTATLLKAKE